MTAVSLSRPLPPRQAITDRRGAARQKSYAETWADPGGIEPAVPCKVIDVSRLGAKLECTGNLPDTFVLHMGETKQVARVVWRRQNQLGVEFQKGARIRRDGGR